MINEISTMACCKHPNIINLHEILEDAEHIYIAMDYV